MRSAIVRKNLNLSHMHALSVGNFKNYSYQQEKMLVPSFSLDINYFSILILPGAQQNLKLAWEPRNSSVRNPVRFLSFCFACLGLSDIFFLSRNSVIVSLFNVFGIFVTFYVAKKENESVILRCSGLRFLIKTGVKFY